MSGSLSACVIKSRERNDFHARKVLRAMEVRVAVSKLAVREEDLAGRLQDECCIEGDFAIKGEEFFE